MTLTNDEMRAAAQAAGLKIGTTIKVDIREKEEGRGGIYSHRTVKGEVLAMYPYIFLCQVGKIKTCFRYSELFGEGRVVRL